MVSFILNYFNKIKKFPYFIATPLPYAMGNASEQILLAANKAKRQNKKLIVIYTNFMSKILRYNICNKSLFNDLIFNKNNSTQIYFPKFIFKILLELEFFLKRSIVVINDFTLKLKVKENERFLWVGILDLYESEKVKISNFKKKKFNSIPNFYINYNLIDLNSNLKSNCNKALNKIGVDTKQKIVCLHVRDAKYRNDKGRKNYRNSDINNYIESIKYLINKDFFVVRIGDKPLNRIKFKNKKFLNYPSSDIKSQEMDLFLINKCYFYIGTQSGIIDTAYMFNKPVLTTNMCEIFSTLPRKKDDRGVFKKILKKDNEPLSIKDFINLSYKYHNPGIDIKDLKFIENTPKELLDSVKEFTALLNVKKKITKKQITFNNFLRKRFEQHFYDNQDKTSLINHTDAIKMIRMIKSSRGYFCNSYLKKFFK